MFDWERKIIRELAKEQLEISQLDIMKENAKLWTLHNDLKQERPMIHFEMWPIVDKGFNYECKCQSDDAKAIEKQIGNNIGNYKMVGDDRVVTDEFIVPYFSKIIPFNMPIKKTLTDGVGFHIEEQIKTLDNIDLIKKSYMEFDYEKSIKNKEFVEDVLGDIINVRFGMGSLYVCMTNEIVHRMGMENMFMAMYDTPDQFHYMMNSLSDDYLEYFSELEKRGMIVANNKNDHLNQGSFGFTTDLPDIAKKTNECWGFLDSQETVGVNPDMFNEFIFPYYKKVADAYGMLSYGCCEPVHSFWEKSISKFENLRKISISPWCDEEYMGEVLSNKGVIYLRKPSPNFVGVGKELDEAGFREHIRKTIKASNKHNLEIAFRDIYNLEGNIDKPRRAVEIVREEISK
jgi:hypothetical protein